MKSWDAKFMELALLVATWSKDPSRKTSAVIVDEHNNVRAIGFNGFPRGVCDDTASRRERPAKYKWTEHAERNAIFSAARSGVSVDKCRMFIPWFPCMECARSIIQAGISELICYEPDWNDSVWAADFADVPVMLKEGGVNVRFVGRRQD